MIYLLYYNSQFFKVRLYNFRDNLCCQSMSGYGFGLVTSQKKFKSKTHFKTWMKTESHIRT